MKTLIFLDESYTAERIEKGPDSIIGYNGDTEVFGFRGVTDFTLYEVDFEWDPATQTPEQMLAEIQELKKRLVSSEDALMGLMEIQMGGF